MTSIIIQQYGAQRSIVSSRCNTPRKQEQVTEIEDKSHVAAIQTPFDERKRRGQQRILYVVC